MSPPSVSTRGYVARSGSSLVVVVSKIGGGKFDCLTHSLSRQFSENPQKRRKTVLMHKFYGSRGRLGGGKVKSPRKSESPNEKTGLVFDM